MAEEFAFDLQLFAEEVDAAAGENAPAENGAEQDTGEQPVPDGGQKPTTILGDTNQPESDKQDDEGGEQKPAAPETYDFKSIVPEGMEYDEQSAQAFGAIAHEMGLSQDQAAKLATYGMQYMGRNVQMAEQARVQQVEQWADEARTSLGNDFNGTVAKAAGAIDRISTKVPGLRDMLNETGAGNRKEMIQLLAAVGDLIGEDNGHDGGVNGSGDKTIYNNTDFSLYK